MRNKDQILLENIYDKIKEQYDAPQPIPPAQISKEKSSMERMGENIFRAAYTDTLKQRGYTDEQIKKYWEEFDKQKQNKKTSSGEIDFQNPETQNKIKQAYRQKGYTDEDLKMLDSLFKPEKINSLKSSMLANGIDINKILQESFVSGIYGDEDKKYSIDRLVKLISSRKPTEIDIDKVIQKNKTLETAEGNFFTNIEKPNKNFYDRAIRANTQYPVMLSEEGWIIDGAHRVSKQKWEGKKTIKVHIITKADLEKTQIFDDEELKKSEIIKH